MSGNTKPDFSVGDVRLLLEARILEPLEGGEDKRRKALAWVELSDQPGLPELYVFDELDGGGFRLVKDGDRLTGNYLPLDALQLGSIGLGQYAVVETPDDTELTFQEAQPGETHLVLGPKRNYDPLFAFRVLLDREQCRQLIQSLEQHSAYQVSVGNTVQVFKDMITSDPDAALERSLSETSSRHGAICRYGAVSAPAPVEGVYAIDAMLVPGCVSPTLILAWVSAKLPGSLTIESALIEQPKSVKSQDLCDYFQSTAEEFGDAQIGSVFDDMVLEFGGTTSLRGIIQRMPAPSGVSAYF